MDQVREEICTNRLLLIAMSVLNENFELSELFAANPQTSKLLVIR